MEYKSIKSEFKALDVDKGIVEGYASVFGNIDAHGDIVEPGAFKKTIRESFSRIKVLWQHWDPFGTPIEMHEDGKGLYTKSQISMTSVNKDNLILMKDGVVTDMSIGYDVIKSEPDSETDKIRHLTELKLWEYSVVTWGANPLTQVTDIKSVRQAEDMLMKLNDVILKGNLSVKNKDLIESTIKNLQTLIQETEPEASTQKTDDEPSKDNGKESPEPDQTDSLLGEALAPLKSMRDDLLHKQLLADFKGFGETLKRR